MHEKEVNKVKNKNLIIFGLLLIIVAGGAFFGGVKYQQSRQKNALTQFAGNRNFGSGQQRMFVNGGRNGSGFRPVVGEITSVDDKSVTVKLNDGSSKIVVLSDKTTFNKAEAGSRSDLKVGENINVFGTANSDGSITAQSIQMGTIFRAMENSPTPQAQ